MTETDDQEFKDEVKILDAAVIAAENFLEKSSHFDSEIQRAEFWRQITGLEFAGGSEIKLGADIIKMRIHCDGHFSKDAKPNFQFRMYFDKHSKYGFFRFLDSAGDINDFLLLFGPEWRKRSREIAVLLNQSRQTVQIIRRNILYPEVAGLEERVEQSERKRIDAINSLEVTKMYLAKIMACCYEKYENKSGISCHPSEFQIGCMISESLGHGDYNRVHKEAKKTISILSSLDIKLFEQKRKIETLETAAETAATDLWHTKGIFGRIHSKTLGRIRENLMAVLPEERREKLCRMLGISCFRGKMISPEPWPEPPYHRNPPPVDDSQKPAPPPPPPKRIINEDIV